MDIETWIVGGVVVAAAIALGWRTFRTVRAELRAKEPRCAGCSGCDTPERPAAGNPRLPVLRGPMPLSEPSGGWRMDG